MYCQIIFVQLKLVVGRKWIINIFQDLSRRQSVSKKDARLPRKQCIIWEWNLQKYYWWCFPQFIIVLSQKQHLHLFDKVLFVFFLNVDFKIKFLFYNISSCVYRNWFTNNLWFDLKIFENHSWPSYQDISGHRWFIALCMFETEWPNCKAFLVFRQKNGGLSDA